ncbi:MAG: putative 2-aminoethylphosphonate transport system permease protein PhnU [Chloroflexi bacterium]|nr:putative 2-aminoethylphosphonate transport system permease protein PhnU [Chloroflexota bacterium]
MKRVLLWLLPLTFLGLFYFYPLGSILHLSFARGEGNLGRVFWEAVASPTVRRVLGFTIWQAFLSTLLTLMIGLPGAYLFARYRFRGKSLLRALAGVPFVMPTLVVAAGFNALLGPRGWANTALMAAFDLTQPPLHFLGTLPAILIAHVFYNTTIVLRMVGDFWSHLDPRLEQAARVLGGNRWHTFREITVPLLTPAILASALLVFLFDFTSFGVILVLGGAGFATLEVEIYYQTISLFNLPMAATLSVLQLACTLALTVIYTRLASRLSRPLDLRPQEHVQRRLKTWRSRLGAGIIIALLLVLLISPLFALAARSVTQLTSSRTREGSVAPGVTLAFYRALSQNPQESLFYAPPTTALGISLGYALATVILSLALGLPAAWALARDKKSTLNQVLDPLLMLPLGTSAVTLGLGFIVSLNRPPFDLRASPWLVPLAHTLVAFPFVVRSLTPALQSIRPNLRQAAAVLGASPRQVFRHVDLPLVGRALLVAATFAFTISIGEFGATALISRPEYPTVPVVIYRFLSRPGAMNYGQALALSTILMLAAVGGMLAIERFRVADVGEF